MKKLLVIIITLISLLNLTSCSTEPVESKDFKPHRVCGKLLGIADFGTAVLLSNEDGNHYYAIPQDEYDNFKSMQRICGSEAIFGTYQCVNAYQMFTSSN